MKDHPARMYVAIEGLKGSGKSTLLQSLLREDALRDVQLIAPTKPSAPAHVHEHLWRVRPLQRCDLFREWVYARRAMLTANSCDWTRSLIIGDRSKLTSYATRWTNWGDPRACIERVNRQQPDVPLPTHVVFLDVPITRLLCRLKGRARTYGRHDETETRLRETHRAYLAMTGMREYGFGDLAWHWIDADRAPEVIHDLRRSPCLSSGWV